MALQGGAEAGGPVGEQIAAASRKRDAMKHREYDVVGLRRALPEHNLPAGSRGAVVTDYAKFSDSNLAPAYEVELANSDGVTQALVTVSEEEIEVVSRANPGT